MSKNLLALSAALAFLASPSAAGEEYMPMHPGARSETGPAVIASPLQRASSADGGKAVQPLQRNVVRLTLPSLGPRPEARPRLVQAGPDGTLDFSSARPISPEELSPDQTGIPGLVPPELLAVDQYNLHDPEPSRRFAESPNSADEPGAPPPASPAGKAGEEFSSMPAEAPALTDLAGDLVGPYQSSLRRLDSLERGGGSAAFSRIELPPAAPAVPDTQSMLVALPPPLAPDAVPERLDPRSSRPPLAPKPAAAGHKSLRPPPADDAAAPSAPERREAANRFVKIEMGPESLRPPAEPLFVPFESAGPPGPELFAAPDFPPPDRSGITPVRELRNVLGPVYRHAGR